jgi:hypothetical protein
MTRRWVIYACLTAAVAGALWLYARGCGAPQRDGPAVGPIGLPARTR